ncbi:MobF family relaxase [Acidocella sp.]|uniref:MobF family relaxase n=1 Tax=Acidocella sp. TaxID=50710 RepID=UPI0026356F5B|nr:MobF family relaxase [Acidocella sp.]MDD2794633.1 MobF family relaxase [Acidocella sp.]
MAEHLLQQTLPPEMAVMAEYYEQGVTPPTPAEAAYSRYSRLAPDGQLPGGAALDELVKSEAARLGESALAPDGSALDAGELHLRAVAAFIGAGLLSREDGSASLERLGIQTNKVASPTFPELLEAAIADATTARDYSSAAATPRRNMDPALARRLGIDPNRGLTQSEIAFLLNGQRADGREIEGKQTQAATLPLTQIFGLEADQKPDRAQLERMLAGQTAAGEALPEKAAKGAVRRLEKALGVTGKEMSAEQREHILSGRLADGKEVSDRAYMAALETSKSRIGYIDLTFSAPKSLSVAWAFAPTNAERAILHQAHADAIESVMGTIEQEIGRARKGKGGKDGHEPGAIGWVSFDHYAARPTVAVITKDEDGRDATELHSLAGTGGRVPGDMQVHTHVAVFNVVETATGRVGGLDLAQLDGRVHEWGALYQAFLAENLRRHGVEIGLDSRNEMMRLGSVPEWVVDYFSKRTMGGTEAARAYAQSLGLDWDGMDAEHKIRLLKSGVQDPRGAKSDDVSDLAFWLKMAEAIGYRHRSVLRPDERNRELSHEERLDRAYRAAMPLLDKQFDRRAVIDGADARVAAAKGLILAGIESADDVSKVTRAFRERGVQRRGEDAALIWGTVSSTQGRERTAVTTSLDEREEKTLIATARAGGRDRSAALTPAKIETAVRAFPELEFSSEHGQAQRAVIDKLGTGGRIGLAIGVAGSGKTTLLKPLVRAWQDDGRTVHGIALAWRQSDDLAEAGIEGRTRAVASFLKAVERGKIALDAKSVVVVDEVGLLGTRQLNDILALQKRTGFQLMMLGDPKQMQSVEAGPVIALLRQALGTEAVPELGSSVRQKDADERETTLMFRNGQTKEAMDRKAINGTFQAAPGGYREAIDRVAELWQERREANRDRPGFTVTVSAPTNAEAHDISIAIRGRRRDAGEIGEDKTTLAASDGQGTRSYSLALAEGDRVRLFDKVNAAFTNGTHGNIGRNGSVLDVVKIQGDGLVLRNHNGKEGFVPWDRLQDDAGRFRLAYGEALTTHTAQGSTVTEHIHAMPSGSRLVTAFGAYTSGSRHREQSFIVTSDGAERAEVAGRRPLGDRREITPGDVLANVTRNFSRQDEKESAVSMLERAANVRRGTIRAVQASLQPMEARTAAQEPTTSLPERLDRRRITRALESRLPGLAERLRRHGESVAQLARAGAALAERLAAIARAKRAERHTERDYWQDVAERASKTPEQTQTQSQARRPGRGR